MPFCCFVCSFVCPIAPPLHFTTIMPVKKRGNANTDDCAVLIKVYTSLKKRRFNEKYKSNETRRSFSFDQLSYGSFRSMIFGPTQIWSLAD